MKHLSNNDFNDNLLTNVPDGTLQHQAVNKGQLDTSLNGKLDNTQLDTDGTLAANSDTKIASQKAVKSYVDDTSLSTVLESLRDTCNYTVKYTPASGSNPYHFLYKIFRKPGVRALRKEMANGVDNAYDAAVTPETPKDAYKRLGANIIVNASGWDNSVPSSGRIRGAQIKDGVPIQANWEVFGVSDTLGKDVLAQHKDGSLGIYESSNYSIQDLLDAGVMDTWSHSAAFIKNGSVVAGVSSHPNYNYKTSFPVVGNDEDGNILIFQSYGVSGSEGHTMATVIPILQSLGFYNAVNLDGGGSTQGYANGTIVMPSSDVSGERAVADFITVNATLLPNAESDWIDLGSPLVGSIFGGGQNCYRILKGAGQGRGVLELKLELTGIVNGNIPYVLPPEARPTRDVFAAVASNGGTDFHVNITTGGNVGIIQVSNLDASRAVRAYARVPLD